MNKLVDHLSEFILPRRLELFDQVLANRTRYITVVLENIFQSQNASAVLRSCDCTGIQDVHVIEDRNNFKLDPEVVLGSSKWLNLYRYNQDNSLDLAINTLKKQGYRLVATTPHTQDPLLPDFDLRKGKAAIFFGTELKGLSKQMLDQADEHLRIPMVGFTESFNISVSAAISLYTLTQMLRNSDIHWQLSQEEMDEVKLTWLRASIRKVGMIEKAFYQSRG